MKNHGPMINAAFLTLILTIATVVSSGAWGQDSQTVSYEVLEAVEAGEAVYVVVMLTEPSVTNHDRTDLVIMRREIAQLQDKVLASLTPSEFRLSIRYANIPAFTGILFPAGIEKLRADRSVVRVDLDTSGAGALDATNNNK